MCIHVNVSIRILLEEKTPDKGMVLIILQCRISLYIGTSYMQCTPFDIKSLRLRRNDLKESILYDAIMSTVYSTSVREYSNAVAIEGEGIFWWL